MQKLKSGDIAALMMLLWLAVHAAVTTFLPQWSSFVTIAACTLPMVLFKHKHRGETFGSRDCNTAKYKKKEYIPFFILTISGCALVSAVTFLVYKAAGYTAAAAALEKDFLFLLVFSCMIPAFFEEWLVRGGVLGALSKYGSHAIWLCAIFFALMHGISKLPYTLFAGLFITAFVYVTECIYLGMLLHFLNNFTSLILSYLSGTAEYIALVLIAVTFAVSFVLLRHSNLFADVKKAMFTPKEQSREHVYTPLAAVFAALSIVIL
ncbi:MAG: CPBP family intramembrane metalloprotease [Clostridia bacterium]|nr:CPBP family intramembrane metalloprotease [Clostridia bacterium]